MMKLGITGLRGGDLVSYYPLLSVVLFRVGYHTSDPRAGLGGRLPLEPSDVAHRWRRPHDPPLGCGNRSAADPPERGAEGPLAPICRRYLRDMFGTRYVRAIHGLLLTAWSMAGIFGPVLVNYIREYNVTHGVAPALAYNVTMYVMAGLLVIGFI